jgi:hypothetical protein
MQAIFPILEEDGKIELKAELNKIFRTVKYKNHDYSFHSHTIEIIKRPPMISLEEYISRHKKVGETKN